MFKREDFPFEVMLGGAVALLWLGLVIWVLNVFHRDRVIRPMVALYAAVLWIVVWCMAYMFLFD